MLNPILHPQDVASLAFPYQRRYLGRGQKIGSFIFFTWKLFSSGEPLFAKISLWEKPYYSTK